jgi:hypothetical protein
MKKKLLIVSLALATSAAFSQYGSEHEDIHTRTIDLNEKSLAFGLTEAQFETIKDGAYTNANFVLGNIYQDDQLIKSGVPMRFNAHADEIEIKQISSDQSYSALVKDPSIFVKIGTEVYVLVPYQGSNEKGGYFNVLYDGTTYDLYKKTKATFKEGQEAKSTYGRDTPPSFVKTTTYYLMEDGRLLEMPSSKSKILKMMDSKSSEMKEFIKKNRLDLDKEADLINAITHFDSLS